MDLRVVRSLLLGLLSATSLPVAAVAGTYATLRSFGYERPGIMYPSGPLTLLNGAFYGGNTYGGANGFGFIFRIEPSGAESTVYSFRGSPDAEFPSSTLVAIDGTLYGTSDEGGDAVACPGLSGLSGCGTVFAMTPGGAESVLYAFHSGVDGGFPDALLGIQGVLYGTTDNGGAQSGGTAFALTLSGIKTVLHNFGGHNDGSQPSSLIFSSGLLYGTTSFGGPPQSNATTCGSMGCGTAFRLTPAGQERVIYDFGSTNYDAFFPSNLLAFNGVLYGASYDGGPLNQCSTPDYSPGCGTIYKIAGNGAETVLHFFNGADGEDPFGGMTNVGGTFYGETVAGGVYGGGTLYSITPSGVFMTLHNFGSNGDGSRPVGGLTYYRGVLYGLTENGGTLNVGTAFSYTP